MPTNAAATEDVAPVVATASATAASSAVAPAAGQKRKACPSSRIGINPLQLQLWLIWCVQT
jgi:hypothetical protein